MQFIKTLLKWLFGALIVAVILEQGVILNYLDYLSVRQNDVYLAYIKSLDPKNKRSSSYYAAIPAYDCAIERIAIIYTYQICVYNALTDNSPPQGLMILRVVKPAGYLTLLPYSYGDRPMMYGRDIFMFANAEVKKQLFKE